VVLAQNELLLCFVMLQDDLSLFCLLWPLHLENCLFECHFEYTRQWEVASKPGPCAATLWISREGVCFFEPRIRRDETAEFVVHFALRSLRKR
jgi:hypothetical protein